MSSAEEVRIKAIYMAYQFYENDAENVDDLLMVAKMFEKFILTGETE